MVMHMHPMNAALRFFLELAALVAMGYWGWTQHVGVARWLWALGLPLVASAVWAVFRIPGDPGTPVVPVPGLVRLLVEIVFFGGAVWLLAQAGRLTWRGTRHLARGALPPGVPADCVDAAAEVASVPRISVGDVVIIAWSGDRRAVAAARLTGAARRGRRCCRRLPAAGSSPSICWATGERRARRPRAHDGAWSGTSHAPGHLAAGQRRSWAIRWAGGWRLALHIPERWRARLGVRFAGTGTEAEQVERAAQDEAGSRIEGWVSSASSPPGSNPCLPASGPCRKPCANAPLAAPEPPGRAGRQPARDGHGVQPSLWERLGEPRPRCCWRRAGRSLSALRAKWRSYQAALDLVPDAGHTSPGATGALAAAGYRLVGGL